MNSGVFNILNFGGDNSKNYKIIKLNKNNGKIEEIKDLKQYDLLLNEITTFPSVFRCRSKDGRIIYLEYNFSFKDEHKQSFYSFSIVNNDRKLQLRSSIDIYGREEQPLIRGNVIDVFFDRERLIQIKYDKDWLSFALDYGLYRVDINTFQDNYLLSKEERDLIKSFFKSGDKLYSHCMPYSTYRLNQNNINKLISVDVKSFSSILPMKIKRNKFKTKKEDYIIYNEEKLFKLVNKRNLVCVGEKCVKIY